MRTTDSNAWQSRLQWSGKITCRLYWRVPPTDINIHHGQKGKDQRSLTDTTRQTSRRKQTREKTERERTNERWRRRERRQKARCENTNVPTKCWERADTRERLREYFSELSFLLLSFLQFSFAENRVFARTKQKGLSTKIEENALMKSWNPLIER